MEHIFIYENGKVTVSGVKSLDGFGEKEARIRLENNSLTIHGCDFVLLDMAQNAGKLSFNGKISSIEYAQKGEKISFLKRIFR